ncbi:MAG: glycerophosphodiester phosphodiesterase [Kouleothrix sp.]|jgi:glycerophosphoryl diester phosphodiesterase|nr:glycerophosphodiester phosphodiesterase [Kouleothrix sp.]
MTLVIAHRGASAYAPENTLPAFELAVRQGADMLELDVLRSADGALVVFHDDTTERWDGRQRLAAQCTLAELQQLDIGGERVATLAEVCAFAREHSVRLNVELKGAGFSADVARMLHAERVEALVLLSSFVEAALHEFAAASPHVPRAYLIDHDSHRPGLPQADPLDALRRVGAAAWHPSEALPLLEQHIPRVRAAGFLVHVWTVDDPARLRALLALGVDGIITNRPDVLRGCLSDQRQAAEPPGVGRIG